jgi:hypothetical protein
MAVKTWASQFRIASFGSVLAVALMLEFNGVPPYFRSFVQNSSLMEKNHVALEKPTQTTTETTTDNATTPSLPPGPFQGNSLEWLQGTRLSNQVEDIDFVWSQILNIDTALQGELTSLETLMDRSICLKEGRFRTHSTTNWNVTDTNLINDWTFRLAYLGIHAWHHAPAMREAKLRQQYNYRGKSSEYPHQVKSFDFECASANFLITSMPRVGMGASFRLGAVNAMLMGMATDRITLFLNHVQSKNVPRMLQEDFWLASCKRSDMQCAFLPTSPCVVTLEDLEQETIVIPEVQARQMRRIGVIPNATMASYRYLYTNSRANPAPDRGLHGKVRKILVKQAGDMINALRIKTNGLPKDKFEVLGEALKRLKKTPAHKRDGKNYQNRNSLIHHAALVYVLRLQRNIQDRVDGQVSKILSKPKFDPQQAIGLPIRGSDKCLSESTCLSFDTYMKLATEVWSENFGGDNKGSVVITTEAKDIANASRLYSGNFSIVMNSDDILQDTGRPRLKQSRSQADAIMESTLVALKLQLHAKFTIGNCCSNFHLLLFDLLRNGCGLGETQQCLQETKNPEYHVCCSWTQSEECDVMYGRKNATRF